MNPASLLKRYEEERRFPRIRIQIPVTIQFDGQREVKALIHDISPEGMQIRCSEGTALRLHPSSEFIDAARRPLVHLMFQLPVGKSRKPVVVAADIRYMLILGEGQPGNAGQAPRQAALGLYFREFRGRSHRYLEQFLFHKNRYQPRWRELEDS